MEEDFIQSPAKLSEFNKRTLIGTAIAGITAGLLTVVLSRFLETYIMTPAFCNDDGAAICQSVPAISFHIASILSAIVAVVILVNASVYRPLLVAIAVIISLWQSSVLISDVSWPISLVIFALLNALAYLTFSWLLRVYNFIFAIVPAIVVAAGLIATFYYI